MKWLSFSAGRRNPLSKTASVSVIPLLDRMVGEAYVHVQASRPKTYANLLLDRFFELPDRQQSCW